MVFCCMPFSSRKNMNEIPHSEYDEIPFSLKWRMHFGKHEVDPHSGASVLRLSNNRLVQTHCESTEYQALKLIARHTSVPAYKVIAVYNRPEGKVVEYEGIPGKCLHTVWGGLSPDKRARIISDLGRFVEQLRKMDPPKHAVVGDSTLGGALDDRFGPGKIGPFYGIDAFHDFMRRGHAPTTFLSRSVSQCHIEKQQSKQPYALKFTHANLCQRNILVDDAGRVSALIGWENSGWYPEYWEYVQMCQRTSKEDAGAQEWLSLMKNVVPKYDMELEADDEIRARFRSEDYRRPRSVKAESITESQLEREQEEMDDKNTENTSG